MQTPADVDAAHYRAPVDVEVDLEPIEWRVTDPRRPNSPLGVVRRRGDWYEAVSGGEECGMYETVDAAAAAVAGRRSVSSR